MASRSAAADANKGIMRAWYKGGMASQSWTWSECCWHGSAIINGMVSLSIDPSKGELSSLYVREEDLLARSPQQDDNDVTK